MITLYVDTEAQKEQVLKEKEYVRTFGFDAYPKKRGFKQRYTLDTNMLTLLLSLDVVVDPSKNYVITTSTEAEKEQLIEQSEYIHYWCEDVWLKRKGLNRWVGLDVDRANWLMHIYNSTIIVA
jgi:hypothetical protein